MEHFTWFSLIPGINALPEHTVAATIVMLLLVLWAYRSKSQIENAKDPVVPDGTLTARNVAEIFVEGFHSIVVESVLGKRGKPYVALYGTFFLFILMGNMFGLIPGFSSPTSNANVTLGLGLTSFVLYNYYGFKNQGIGYLKHFTGPILWLIPLMLPLEIISNLIRPVTLNLRLMMNMSADHLVLGLFTDLTKLVIPVIFIVLGTFVCVVQAFVFTLLSLVYVSMATESHDHEEHAHGHGEKSDAHAH